MAPDPVDIVGLKAFNRELKSLKAGWERELRLANKASAELIAAGTRSKLESFGGVRRKSAASVKARATQTSASVRIGGPRHPFALGANFGSQRYKQFPAIARPDYGLHTTIEAKRDEMLDAYGDAVERIVDDAFPN